MELFGLYFSWFEIIIFIVIFITFLYQLYFYLRYMAGSMRRNKKIDENEIDFVGNQPPVSIVIAAKNEEKNLKVFLPKVLEQIYPEYEVIVVDDASDDETSTLLDDFKKKYPNLHTTFVPEGTKNISSKKLAVTLGIKAAKYDLLLLTDADCFPENVHWITTMMRNFTDETHFVLGYGGYLKKEGFLNRMINFDTLFIGLQYLGMALVGRPYMGVGRNLAYRKEVFFQQKGFSANLDLLSGDDDLIVNKAANCKNTKAETSLNSITWSEPKTTFKGWFYQKTRHLSASKRYKKSTKFILGLEPFTRALFYLSFIFALIWGNLFTIIAACVLFLGRLALQLLIINRASAYYKSHKFYFSLPFFDMFLPVVNLFILLTKGSRRHYSYW